VNRVDDGFYGQGIYFTRDMDYAALYSNDTPKVFVLAAVNPGNVFPTTEHPFSGSDQKTPLGALGFGSRSAPKSLKGKPGVPGYQSHYTVVPKKNIDDAFPLTGNRPVEPAKHADELVVFQEAQALPLFIIYTS